MISPTTQRVELHTDRAINEENLRLIVQRVAEYSAKIDKIDRRLDELEHEWDIERTLEANAATISLIGLMLGATRHRAWFMLPMVVAAFLLQHAVQGWCPPVPILRRLGVRTPGEIAQERYALKALRGDFKHVSDNAGEDSVSRAQRALEAVRT